MSKKFFLTVIVGCCIVFAGCDLFTESPMDLFTSTERYTGDRWLLDRYDQVILKASSSAEVLSVIQQEGDFLSQSESVVASWDDKRKGSMVWFSAVAFRSMRPVESETKLIAGLLATGKLCCLTNSTASRYVVTSPSLPGVSAPSRLG